MPSAQSEFSENTEVAKSTFSPQQKRQVVWCFFSLLFLMPYLQHNFFHTTLFGVFGTSSFAVFTLFSTVLALCLACCIAFQKQVGQWLAMRSSIVALSAVALGGTAAIFVAPTLFDADVALIWGLLGAVCYAVGLSGVAVRTFMVLGELSCQTDLKTVVTTILIAALVSLTAFAKLVPTQLYTFIAICGVGLSGAAQIGFGALEPPAKARDATKPALSDAYNRSWQFFYVIFFAIVLLHGLLYVADPTIESRGDAPLSLTITFVLLLALSLILAGASSKPNQYLQIICLFGNVLFVFLFLGLIAVSFLSVTHGDFSFAAIVVLALARVFDGLLLVALAVNSFSGNSGPVRSFSLYLLILYWLPTAFSYVLLPVLTTNFAFDTSAILGSASLAIAAVLVLAIVVIFSFFMVKAGPRESKEDGNTNAENRRTACAFLARQFGLTQREEEVLYYVSLGYSSKIAGEKLFVAPGTVQSHTRRIYTKLGVHSKQQLISLVDESESK